MANLESMRLGPSNSGQHGRVGSLWRCRGIQGTLGSAHSHKLFRARWLLSLRVQAPSQTMLVGEVASSAPKNY